MAPTYHVRSGARRNLSVKMHADSFSCLAPDDVPLRDVRLRWRGARVKEHRGRGRERRDDVRHRDTGRQRWSLCASSRACNCYKKKWKKMLNIMRLRVVSRRGHSSFTWGEEVYSVCVVDCGFICGNWPDIGLSITLSILLCWLKLSAFRERCDKNTQTRTCTRPLRLGM